LAIRLLRIFHALLLSSVEPKTFIFGSYDGKDIEWLVLDAQGDKALVITKDIIDRRKYNKKYVGTTWEQCDLRQWLNGDFYTQAFSSIERSATVLTNVSYASAPQPCLRFTG
jgi:hypothetical protein